jgi:hypothetical protein
MIKAEQSHKIVFKKKDMARYINFKKPRNIDLLRNILLYIVGALGGLIRVNLQNEKSRPKYFE